jgi:hypothetical protein
MQPQKDLEQLEISYVKLVAVDSNSKMAAISRKML